MSNPKLSQTALYEVLVCEIESLKTTKGAYSKVIREIDMHLARLEELYKQPIPVDIKPLRSAEERIQDKLDKGFYIPKWLIHTFIGISLALCLSLSFNYRQHLINRDQVEQIEDAKAYIQELKEQLPKSKNRK